ncbi:GNAT family acetyltransferase [Rhodoferax sp.]|uniref:GNAT family acetyltransferase n=1 Tax=Rhodoferax sp. TaxID=50421 RepID=UPI002619E203|nr:GNAT family acetyltransferase [Rhodoferax sp.]MDD2920130.1 GNAT family acetyltransferase [Rhodoferax sp.]
MCPIIEYSDAIHRAQVMALWQVAFGYEDAHNAPDLVIDKKLAMDDGLFFVAMAEGAVAGTIMAGYDGHRGWLYSVAVHPAQRKQGLGGALVRHAENALIRRGCLKINLQIRGGNERVAAFYESLGFVIEPRVSMGKRIGQNIQAALPPW